MVPQRRSSGDLNKVARDATSGRFVSRQDKAVRAATRKVLDRHKQAMKELEQH